MIYIDTSFLIPYYIKEISSQSVEKALRTAPIGNLYISHWTKVEFASMLARAVRMQIIPTNNGNTLMQALEKDIETSFDVLDISLADFEFAVQLLLKNPSTGLHGPDALHLAIAYQNNAEIYSLDKGLIKVANAIGIKSYTL